MHHLPETLDHAFSFPHHPYHSIRLSPSFFIFFSFSTFFLFLNFLLSFPFLLSYVPPSGRTTGLLILCFEADIFVLLRNINLFISTGILPLHVDLLLNLLVFHTWSPLKMFPSRSSDIIRFAFSISKLTFSFREKEKGKTLMVNRTRVKNISSRC